MTILKCAYDGHEYERPSQRGRPQKYCDLHKPADKPIIHTKINLNKIETPKSVTDIVPGLADLLEEENTEELVCEFPGGAHPWQRKKQRGRRPRFCPDHKQVGEAVRREEAVQANYEAEKNTLLARIAAQGERVEGAGKLDDEVYEAFSRNPANEIAFKEWMKYNTRLMNEIISLRTTENKLEKLK